MNATKLYESSPLSKLPMNSVNSLQGVCSVLVNGAFGDLRSPSDIVYGKCGNINGGGKGEFVQSAFAFSMCGGL